MSASAMDFVDAAARGITIRFHAGNGRLRVWAERFEEIEPELLDLLDSLPSGTIFYDVGASIGLFSLYAAIKRQCRVFAFEAEAANYATLERNHFLNQARLAIPITALNVALSDGAGLGHIYTRVYGAGEHGKVLDQAVAQDTKQPFQHAHAQAVLKQTLDGLVGTCALPLPEVLKIDVDGAEAALLRGARSVLASPSLRTVFIELSDASDADEPGILLAHGFELSAKFPVVRLSGGHYPGLHNCIFTRS